MEAQKGGDGGDKGTGWGAEREEGGKGEEGVDRAEQGTQTGKSPVDKEPGAGLNTFDCPVCRKPQIVDDSGLQVDEELR